MKTQYQICIQWYTCRTVRPWDQTNTI